MPNSFQNDESMSVDLVVSLPEILVSVPVPAPAPLLRDDDDDGERDGNPPCADNRSLLLRDPELRGVLPLTSVALIPSSPTVACRISSKNVHNPSRRSEAICLPVCISASRDGGGIVFRHCVTISSVGCIVDDGPETLSGLRSMKEGSGADRGGLPI